MFVVDEHRTEESFENKSPRLIRMQGLDKAMSLSELHRESRSLAFWIACTSKMSMNSPIVTDFTRSKSSGPVVIPLQ